MAGLIDAVQVIYNIFDQSPERNLFPVCLEHNIGVLARVPLDEGGLTGNITESTRFEPRVLHERALPFSPEEFDRGFRSAFDRAYSAWRARAAA